jgi:sugar phosphate isomerase/epimerase
MKGAIMHGISRRTFVKTASASAVAATIWSNIPSLMANPLGLPLGLQLYSVRDVLPKDYDGTLHQIAALGFQEVEAAGFFGHNPEQVKQAMQNAGLHCVSAHYSLEALLPKVDETIQFGKDLGLNYIVCAAPWFKDPSKVKGLNFRASRELMTLEDWRWNADQFNQIGEKVKAAGMHFAYHNHTPEFRQENGVMFYDELMSKTDPAKVAFELDCGWAVIAGQNPAELLKRYSTRICMLHVKDFKMTPSVTPANAPPSTELGHGTIDYHPIFEAAKKADIKHVFIEQEEFDMPEMEALKIDADYMKAFKV